MNNPAIDYLEQQIRELDQKITETELLKSDPDMVSLAQTEIDALKAQKQTLLQSITSLKTPRPKGISLVNPIDSHNAIIEIRPGTGGEEAKLFAADLLRMYLRFADTQKFKLESLDDLVVKIKGKGAYGLFKHESGVHRVQRVPATESQGRIHTSTASVAVLPEVTPLQVVIHEEDLEWKFSRAGGHGGQNVNKVSTAVTLTHKPSGLVVHCRQERYQQQNKIIALDLLRSQLWEIEEEKRLKSIEATRQAAVGRAMRAEKIRTYNYPSNRVTDHRIPQSWTSLDTIIEGDLSMVISALTTHFQSPPQTPPATE
jgi:peptide chain release factor 1